MINRGLDVEHIDPPNHFIYGAKTKFSHILANLFGDKEKEVDHVLGLALKLLSENGILRGNADRTSIEMALAHHDAAHRDQRRRGETEFFRAEQRGNDDVTP
ncbi:MAG TPA: hypothetical protein VMR80_13390, partial [Candidatus Acidoferrum sp.]|nr:hypothetical protein [Candidatus Acidoferrum sp.]